MKNFSALLAAARRGDAASLSELHRRFAPALLARLRSQLGPKLRRTYDSQDLGQSLFLDVLRDLPRFRDQGERAFRAWLYLKATNKIRSKCRRQFNGAGEPREVALTTNGVFRDPAPGPATTAGHADALALLRDRLAMLRPEQQEILILRGQRRLPYSEVATRLNITRDAARMRYTRALIALQKQWTTR